MGEDREGTTLAAKVQIYTTRTEGRRAEWQGLPTPELRQNDNMIDAKPWKQFNEETALHHARPGV